MGGRLGLWLAATAAVVLAASGCGGNSADRAADASLGALISSTTGGVQVDYTPLEGPADAIETADAIISGTLVDIVPGVRIVESDEPDLRSGDGESLIADYVAYVIDVAEVLSSKPGIAIPDRVEVQVLANRRSTAAELAKLNTRPEAIMALDVVITVEDSSYSLIKEDGSTIETGYFPYTDLFWLDDGSGPRAPYLDSLEELAPGWGEITSLADLADVLRP